MVFVLFWIFWGFIYFKVVEFFLFKVDVVEYRISLIKMFIIVWCGYYFVVFSSVCKCSVEEIKIE